MNEGLQSLKDTLSALPHQSGVYRFLNKDGKIIYVGKAKDLKKRVSQYFTARSGHSQKTQRMVSLIHKIEHTVVASESDALLLENNLIKTLQPRYNVLLKDDKTYPWIAVKNEAFPRVLLTRRIPKDGSRYFGPYTSAYFARRLLDLIYQLYPLRTCNLALNPEQIAKGKYKVCLKAHIGRCAAPCVQKISQENYNAYIEAVIKILRGDSAEVQDLLKAQMLQAAENREFEQAQAYKLQLEALALYRSKSVIVSTDITDVDVFSIVTDTRRAYANFLRVAHGAVIYSRNMSIRLGIEERPERLLSLFMAEILQQRGSLSKELLVPFMPDGEWGAHVLHVPQKGDKKALVDLSLRNAKAYRIEQTRIMEKRNPQEHLKQQLLRLQADLNLPTLPSHIECFDNSNIMGAFPVASCVVFKNARPSKKDYRHFNIKTVSGPDDFASMTEVVTRRYSRLLREGRPLPQLIVIDGGKGQLSAARKALENLGLAERIAVVGLAKRMEEIYLPADPLPLFLDKNTASLKILMQLRDEAHRFGITHHRNRRSAQFAKSSLTDIKGIGPKTAALLLNRYKSLKRLKEAGFDSWKQTAGLHVARLLQVNFGLPVPNEESVNGV